jgi:regulator of sigma E protease
MFDFFWNLFSFILVLGILVTAHEYGHFWVARKCGVKVKRFSVGFGKTLWRKTDRQGTEFVISAIPLGGYVSMLDERVESVPDALKNQAFNQKSVYQRIAIIAAGPLANFLLAIIAFYLMFLIGLPGVKPIVAGVTPGSVAAQGQFASGTEIIAVNQRHTPDWQSVNMALVASIGEPQLVLSTREQGNASAQNQTLSLKNWQYEPSEQSAIEGLGLQPYTPKLSPVISQVATNSAAAQAGMLVGDEVLSVNNIPLSGDWQKLVSVVKQNPGKSLSLSLVRDGQPQTIVVIPDARQHEGQLQGFLGVSPTVAPWPDDYLIELSYGPVESLNKALQQSWNLIVLSLDMLGKLISGDVSWKNLSGPISIAQGAGHSVGYGFVYFLSFLALISINLGIINLLPLPVLDGGHLLYYLIELVTGKPVPENIQEVGFKVGALALLGLMSIAIFNDLSRL